MNDKNIVVMFPYPSGAGLHLGHYYNYAIIDSYCRWLRYNLDMMRLDCLQKIMLKRLVGILMK